MARPKTPNPRYERVAVALSTAELALVDAQRAFAAERGHTMSRAEIIRAGWLMTVGKITAGGETLLGVGARNTALSEVHAMLSEAKAAGWQVKS